MGGGSAFAMTEKVPHFVIGKRAKLALEVRLPVDSAELADSQFRFIFETLRQRYGQAITLCDEIYGSVRG